MGREDHGGERDHEGHRDHKGKRGTIRGSIERRGGIIGIEEGGHRVVSHRLESTKSDLERGQHA